MPDLLSTITSCLKWHILTESPLSGNKSQPRICPPNIQTTNTFPNTNADLMEAVVRIFHISCCSFTLSICSYGCRYDVSGLRC